MNNKDSVKTWLVMIAAALAFFGVVPGTIKLFADGESFLGFCNIIAGVLGGFGWYTIYKKVENE